MEGELSGSWSILKTLAPAKSGVLEVLEVLPAGLIAPSPRRWGATGISRSNARPVRWAQYTWKLLSSGGSAIAFIRTF